MPRRANKETFYWLGFYKQITEFISRCSICNSYNPEQQKGPDGYVTKHLHDYDRASQQTWSISMAPTTWLQLSATLISSKWIYRRLRLPEWVLTSWNLIWQDMVFQIDSPQTTAHSSAVLSFRSLQRSISLKTLKRLYGFLSPTGRPETVSKQQRISWEERMMQAMTHTSYSSLDFRNTPSEWMDSTPAQCLFSHRTRTSLPITSHLLQPKVIPDVHLNL